MKTITPKTKKQKSKEVQAWSLPLLRDAMLVEDCWTIKEIDAMNVNQQINAK